MENVQLAHIKEARKVTIQILFRSKYKSKEQHWEFRQTNQDWAKQEWMSKRRGTKNKVWQRKEEQDTKVGDKSVNTLKCETPLESYWLTAAMSISISDQKHFNDLLVSFTLSLSFSLSRVRALFTQMTATQMAATRQRYHTTTSNPMFAKRISKSTFKNKKSVSKSWHTYKYTVVSALPRRAVHSSAHTSVCVCVYWSVLLCHIVRWRWAILRVISIVC